jgi:hypothetical protein
MIHELQSMDSAVVLIASSVSVCTSVAVHAFHSPLLTMKSVDPVHLTAVDVT